MLFRLLCRVDTRSLFRLRRVCRRFRDMFEYVLGVRVRDQSVEPFAVMLVDHYMLSKTFNEELDRQQSVIQQNYLEAMSGTRLSWVREDPDDDEILLFMSSGESSSVMDDDLGDDLDDDLDDDHNYHDDTPVKKLKFNHDVIVG